MKKLKNAGVLRFSSRFFTSLRLTPSGPKFLYKRIEDVGAHSVRPRPSALFLSLRANNVRPYNNVCHCL